MKVANITARTEVAKAAFCGSNCACLVAAPQRHQLDRRIVSPLKQGLAQGGNHAQGQGIEGLRPVERHQAHARATFYQDGC